jgi:hypothetical protein
MKPAPQDPAARNNIMGHDLFLSLVCTPPLKDLSALAASGFMTSDATALSFV